MADDRFCFLADWYDAQASLNRRYQLLFYPIDNSVELFEVKTKRHFLKRCKYESLRMSDLYIGSMVTILSRTMKIVEYGDAYTARSLSSNQQKTIGLLISGHMVKLGQIIDNIYKSGLKIAQMRKIQISTQDAYDLLQSQRDRANFSVIANSISEGPIVVMELMGSDAQAKWINIIGSTDITADLSLDASNRINDLVLKEHKIGRNTAAYSDSTCCVIKPHLVSSGMAGAVIYEIQKAGFDIGAISAVNFTKPNAEEFLEVYKGVVHEYPEMVDELTSGTCIALEVRGPDAQNSFRQLSGPHDPEIARNLRPTTLRAMFGSDKIRNGVHATDLAEDAILEVEYFFRILDR